MHQKTAAVFLILATASVLVSTQPLIASDSTPSCYQHECPPRTTGCKKVVKTSGDKHYLSTTISCLDIEAMSLKDYMQKDPNPYGPHTHYISTSYSATHVLSSHNKPVNININNSIEPSVKEYNTGTVY